MKIIFDCRYVRVGAHDGISRFSIELVTELARLHSVTMLIHDYDQLAKLPDLPWELVSSPQSWREIFVAKQLNALEADVVFSPMQTMGSFGKKYALILTVHDLIYYSHRQPPKFLPVAVRILWRLYHLAWWPQRLLLNRAEAIVTVSNTTAQAIEARKLTHNTVSVVPNATRFTEESEKRTHPKTLRLVYMGSFVPYKNVSVLARAVELIPGVHLHVMSHIDEREREIILRLAPSATVIFHNGVSDEQYRDILSRSTALVSASRAEGFGIPLVESMALGTPIVVSDIDIFREIGGKAAFYCDPDRPEEFAKAFRELCDPAVWAEASRRSILQAQKFRWDKSAVRLLKVIRAAARGYSR